MREVDRIANLLPEKIDALLIARGNRPNQKVIMAIASRCQNVVAIDGGLRHLRNFDLRPNVVIGDFDSVKSEDLAWARRRRAHVGIHDEQDSSDMDKALNLCKQKGWKSVVIAGVDGSRTDHFLYSIYQAASQKSLIPAFVFQHTIARSLRGRMRLELSITRGRIFSWLGLPEASGATLSNAQWPFTNRKLKFGDFQSLSNVATETTVKFSQQSGNSLIIIPIGKA